MPVSFYGVSSGRINTTVAGKDDYAGKSRPISLNPPAATGGDSGATCAFLDSNSGKWALVGIIHRVVGSYTICSPVDVLISHWDVYPKLV
ncbi:MAG: hypothetical protein QXJ62_06230 [Nitrososphaeria archaeon]